MTLDHNAIYKAYPNVTNIDDGQGAKDKDGKSVTLEQSKKDAARVELAKLDYKYKRATAYPSLEEQLDLQYWDQVNGTTKWKEAIAKIKADNPKP